MTAWALPLLIFCGSAPAAGASRQEPPDQAERLSQEGRHDPKNFEAWLARGRLLRQEGKSSEAENALKKALALTPDAPEAEDELTAIYYDMGRFEEAVRLLKDRIEKKPREYSLYSQLARTYIRLGRSAEAKDTFARAKKIDDKMAYIDEGYFYLHSGRPVEARADFESAVAVDTASPFGYHHMGAYLSGIRRYPEAEKYFRRALEKLEADPKMPAKNLVHTLQWLGDAVKAQGRYAEAEAVYREALGKAQPGDDSQLYLLHSLADLYASLGKSAQAEETYQRAAAVCAVRFKCRFLFAASVQIDLGEFYLGQGRRAEAEAAARRAEKASEDIPIGQGFAVLGNFAAFYAQLGDAPKEAALYARLMPMRRAMPFNPELVWVEKGLAGMDAAQGRFGAAENHYRRAIGILEHNGSWKEEADALDRLAAIREKEDKRTSAAEAREQAKALRARP